MRLGERRASECERAGERKGTSPSESISSELCSLYLNEGIRGLFISRALIGDWLSPSSAAAPHAARHTDRPEGQWRELYSISAPSLPLSLFAFGHIRLVSSSASSASMEDLRDRIIRVLNLLFCLMQKRSKAPFYALQMPDDLLTGHQCCRVIYYQVIHFCVLD